MEKLIRELSIIGATTIIVATLCLCIFVHFSYYKKEMKETFEYWREKAKDKLKEIENESN